MTKAIFFDVDGTLVSFKTHTMSPATLQALHTLREKGILLFLSTGRHQAMLDYVRDLFPFDGYVALGGQYNYAVDLVVTAVEDGGFSCIFLEGTDIYINGVDDMASQFIKDLNIPTPPIRPARYALGHQVYQAVTFLDREHEGQLLDRAPHLLTTRWHPNFLDVIPPTGGKDKGLEAVLAHFGIPVEESMAFGDGENDLAMLVRAGVGVAMGTASDYVKERADWTTASVDDEGIVRALEHFGLL